MSYLKGIGWMCLFAWLIFGSCEGHEGHVFADSMQGSLARWLSLIGQFHLLVLHFPIALIVMTVVAEWLRIWFNNALFEHAARFMIIAAAIFAPPTALFGLALGYGQTYEGLSLDLFLWHRYFGLVTAGLAVVTAILRECYTHRYVASLTSYYLCLFILFLCINITGTFGGSLAFGIFMW